jgi:ABC-2 type transport system permease protein
MTLLLAAKLLRDVRPALIVVCLLLIAFSCFWVKIAQRVTTEIAPFFQGVAKIGNINPKLMEEVVFKGPGKISQSVMGGADVRFERPNDFLAVELLHPVVLTLCGLWAVGRASGAIAGELDRGTMELLLSQPVPRGRLIFAHGLVDLAVIPLICLSLVAGTQLGLWLVGPFSVDFTMLDKLTAGAPTRFKIDHGPDVLDVSAARQIWGTVNTAGLMFAFSGISIAISSVNRSRWTATGYACFIYIAMFITNVVGQLWDTVAAIRPASLFFYYQPQKIWLLGDWTVSGIPVMLVLLGVGVIGYGVAYRVFTQRDLPAPL